MWVPPREARMLVQRRGRDNSRGPATPRAPSLRDPGAEEGNALRVLVRRVEVAPVGEERPLGGVARGADALLRVDAQGGPLAAAHLVERRAESPGDLPLDARHDLRPSPADAA